jgi:TolA-binding protein
MMKTNIGFGRARLALALMLAPTLAITVPLGHLSSAQAQANPESTEDRLRRIEAELRAVQRKVFPEGAGKTYSPEIGPSINPVPAVVPGSSAIGDLLTRMDAVEAQLQRLTAASEANQNHLAKIDARLGAMVAMPGNAAPASGAYAPQLATTTTTAVAMPSATGSGEVAKPSVKPPAKPAVRAETGRSDPPADRVAAVLAVEKPTSDDKGEDEYTYGYRLWEAKFFPEAQQQLLRVVQQYPRHMRISYARNLLGRAYLDDGKPGTAAQYFLQNYQADHKGDRAADSLLYLGVAMSRLKEEKRACVAFAEFRQTYPAETAGRLKSQFEAAIKPVTCN